MRAPAGPATYEKLIDGPFGRFSGLGSLVTSTPLALRSAIVLLRSPVERQPMWSMARPMLGTDSPLVTRIHTVLKPSALYFTPSSRPFIFVFSPPNLASSHVNPS